MNPDQRAYLQAWLDRLPPDRRPDPPSVSAGHFCADEHDANVCVDLILRGEKTATCSLARWYSHEGEAMPEVGHLQVVTDWDGVPRCIIETTEVWTCRFGDVSAAFARAEGEGDKSLAWWRQAHRAFFAAECETLGVAPSDDMLLVLERFRRVHPTVG